MKPIDPALLSGIHVYYNPYSNCSQRVQLLCAEKQLDVEWHEIDLLGGEQLSDAFRAITPECAVPAMVHDGKRVYDSVTIMRYLEKAFPSPSMTPDSELEKGQMEQLLDQASASHMQQVVPYVYAQGIGRLPTPEQKAFYDRYVPVRSQFHNNRIAGKVANDKQATREVIDRQFSEFDKVLSKQPWLAGEQYSLADIAWYANYSLLRNLGYKLPHLPHFQNWVNAIESRPAYKTGIKDHLKPILECMPGVLLRCIAKTYRLFGNRK